MTFIARPFSRSISRRNFLGLGASAVAAAGLGAGLVKWKLSPEPEVTTRFWVPRGFTPRIIARSGQRLVVKSYYRWHSAPDGGGCFATGDGGWIYVSNGELTPGGGVSALRFDAAGTIVDCYGILSGSRHNCSGCETPWNTWLSCEEHPRGIVWECDPFGQQRAQAHPALGVFKHESAAVDPVSAQIYLTEDRFDGCLYRFTPAQVTLPAAPDLGHGVLEVAMMQDSRISWVEIPDPAAAQKPLRYQVNGAHRFDGGEGIDIVGGLLRFTTKGDGRIWQIALQHGKLGVLHDLEGLVSEVDDLTHTADGDIVVAEEGSPLRILFIPGDAERVLTLVQLPDHHASEITGLAFDPTGERLYFSSQRGNTGLDEDGVSFELMGDFRRLSVDTPLVEWNLENANPVV